MSVNSSSKEELFSKLEVLEITVDELFSLVDKLREEGVGSDGWEVIRVRTANPNNLNFLDDCPPGTESLHSKDLTEKEAKATAAKEMKGWSKLYPVESLGWLYYARPTQKG